MAILKFVANLSQVIQSKDITQHSLHQWISLLVQAKVTLLISKNEQRMDKEKTNDLTPERVIQILKKKGTEVDLEEAQAILEFVKKIAHIAVNQYLRGKL
ncbi:MAG TPA: hypothetical protein VNQ80_13470 [Parapedobacter sp.]|nr:hypothetical protein [Parapedobacter sp.]HWK58347.1 hypothetical protein [Parapedobacter sp.]